MINKLTQWQRKMKKVRLEVRKLYKCPQCREENISYCDKCREPLDNWEDIWCNEYVHYCKDCIKNDILK